MPAKQADGKWGGYAGKNATRSTRCHCAERLLHWSPWHPRRAAAARHSQGCRVARAASRPIAATATTNADGPITSLGRAVARLMQASPARERESDTSLTH